MRSGFDAIFETAPYDVHTVNDSSHQIASVCLVLRQQKQRPGTRKHWEAVRGRW